MKAVEMDNDVVLKLIDEVILYRGTSLYELVEMFPEEKELPSLVFYGRQCKYVDLVRIKTPFIILDESHPDYNISDSAMIQLVAKTPSEKYFQIGFNPKFSSFYPDGVFPMESMCKPLPADPEIIVSIHGPQNIRETYLSKKGYFFLGNDLHRTRALIIGDACKKQLQEWGILEEIIKKDRALIDELS